ncbi:calmodulin-lysine N-methyltransferase [Patella vulgata]|uniref:calmodulin-lysine N-methyltransferase n=1 Tax=Patella vulgata TaxID=6465 RepID=UPI00217FCDED|nr:calmodulin-lysine N-methyltransferase [Patella vulgata]
MLSDETDHITSCIVSKPRIARQRWSLLAQIISNGDRRKDICKNVISIRRFESFGLFRVDVISEEEECKWWEYKTDLINNFTLIVRQLCGCLRADKLQGFNNTGNVCIWPAEEIMSYYCLLNAAYFRNKSVIEIGGGMTCLAGFSIAVGTEAEQVQITDGNEDSVKNLEIMRKRNKENYGQTQVESSLFRWGSDKLEGNLQENFDVVLCSDCLFFEEGRKDLIKSMYNLLKPQGEVIVFAPRRGETFNNFMQLAQEKFHTEIKTNYNATIWKLHSKFKEDSLYDENIHYPILLKMKKKYT